MIVVRNVFRLKFGRAKEGVALFKEGVALSQRLSGGRVKQRILTDLVGDFYTIVLENSFGSLSEMEQSMPGMMGNEEWRAWYAKVPALVESGHREIFSVVE